MLLRELDPDQMHLQHNKVTNLRLAASRMDGLVIAPGETFSFNRVVGSCTRRKGYVDGMKLSNGEVEAASTAASSSARGWVLRREGRVYRRNQIWRRAVDRRTGDRWARSRC